MHRFALIALPLMLAACGDAPGEGGQGGTPETPAGLEDAVLDLQATGIIIPAQAGFERLEVPFGSNRAATEATLANIIGAHTEQAAAPDCGEDVTRLSYDGLTIYFDDGAFVGYVAQAPYVPEISRAEMLSDSAVALVEDGTLGEEFTIGAGDEIISGMFSGEDDGAAVEALWAGESCIFR